MVKQNLNVNYDCFHNICSDTLEKCIRPIFPMFYDFASYLNYTMIIYRENRGK